MAKKPDPTANVIANLNTAIKRIDDLRKVNNRLLNSKTDHLHEISKLRARYEEKLREAESKRLNAIRAVDVAAVASSSRDAAITASALAAQQTISAETLRNQVELTKTAASGALSTALSPIQDAISELRKFQYDLAGQKQGSSETTSTHRITIGQQIALAGLILTPLSGIIVAIILKH